MKISLNWLKQYINLDETIEKISEILTKCGLEVGHVSSTISTNPNLKDLLIGEVIECMQHPNADRLKLLKINLGEGNIRQIVCGAPNVALFQKVIVAPVGTVLCDGLGNKLVIKNSKIRGILSEGMICSAAEIGLGNDSDGIVVLDTILHNGTKFEKSLLNDGDTIFDIELTPNRGDACSHIGVARDLSAVFDRQLRYPQVYEDLQIKGEPFLLRINFSSNVGCRRYSGVVMTNVDIKDSPKWLKDRLKSIGLIPKNNLLDIATYVMYELGQPLHIYDYDLIKNKTVSICKILKSVSFTTLDGKQRTVGFDELSILDDSGPICIPGLIGGDRTAVNAKTKSIFIEAAFFDQSAIRKISKTHNLSTDASFRFERGTGNDTIFALKRAIYLIHELTNGSVSSEIFDFIEEELEQVTTSLSLKNLEKVSGINIPLVDVKKILQRLEIVIDAEAGDILQLTIPMFKADVTREIDVIEEIMRIYGYDKINADQVLSSDYLSSKSDCGRFDNVLDISKVLLSNGFFEIRTNPITNSKNSKFLALSNGSEIVSLLNPLSNIMDSMRQNLVFSGLEVIIHNINRQQNNLKIFEFGKTYDCINGRYLENDKLCLWMTGGYNSSNLIDSRMAFGLQDLKTYIYNILETFGVLDLEVNESSNSLFEKSIILLSDTIEIGELGVLSDRLLKNFAIEQKVFFADISWKNVINLNSKTKTIYKSLPKYPAIERDISIFLDENINFAQIKNLILSEKTKLMREVYLSDIYTGGDLPLNSKSYLIKVVIQSHDKTLESTEVYSIMQSIESALIKNFNAKIRG